MTTTTIPVTTAQATRTKRVAKSPTAAAVARLYSVARTLEARCDEYEQHASARLENTARRVAMAQGADADNRRRREMAKTLRNIAAAVESGTTTYLSRISTAAQVEQLRNILTRAMHAADRAANKHYRERDAELSDVIFAEYPWPYLHGGPARAILVADPDQPMPGRRVIRQNLGKDRDDLVYFTNHADAEVVRDTLGHLRDYDQRNALDTWKRYDRIRALAVNIDELRGILGEFLEMVGRADVAERRALKIKQAERDLVGLRIEGFWPTPRAVAEILAQYVTGSPRTILEPSAGSGALADFARETWPEARVDCVEIVPRLRAVLEIKGHNLVGLDFTEWEPDSVAGYDLVLMNPPFERFQDIDHVRRAWSFVADGGNLVAIMSAGVSFRQDRVAAEFRAWADSIGAVIEPLPEGSFEASGTGVNTVVFSATK